MYKEINGVALLAMLNKGVLSKMNSKERRILKRQKEFLRRLPFGLILEELKRRGCTGKLNWSYKEEAEIKV